MRRSAAIVLAVLGLAGPTGGPAAGTPARRAAGPPRPAAVALARETFGRVTSSFVENRGQAHPEVLFYGSRPGAAISLTARGVVLALGGERVAVEFVGADPAARPAGRARTAGTVSVFRGTPDRWRSGIPAFAEVCYPDLWPGVDMIFRSGEDGRLKYDLVVAPGADPDRIRLAYRAVGRARLTGAGEVEIETSAGTLREAAPVAYQEVGGRRTPVASAFRRAGGANGLEVGFAVGAYDAARPLVIDPEILFSGLLGGSHTDIPADVAVDAAGNIYVAGSASSAPQEGFPVAVGPVLTFDTRADDRADAFVTKIGPDGSTILYSGYIGGERFDYATGVAVDSQGNAYVCGTAYSNSETEHFPVAVGPTLQLNDGASSRNPDAFVSKVSADGSQLLYSGYLPGLLAEEATDVAVDASGAAFVIGTHQRVTFFNVDEPTGCDATDTQSSGFVVKVRPDGSGLVFQNFMAGTGLDRPLGVAVDAAGAIYVTGVTTSPTLCFVKKGPRLTPAGAADAFVGKLKPDLTEFEYLGFIGGASDDVGVRVAADSSGHAYVVGLTRSTEATFPVAVGPDLTHAGPAAGYDAFVAKVKPDGTGLVYCGYVGGAADDAAAAVAVDGQGRAYVVGFTASTEATFPLVDPTDGTWNGGTGVGDAFVAQVAANGRSLEFSTFLGGTNRDAALGVALDSQRRLVVVGSTDSTDGSFPTTANAFNTAPRGGADVFVAKLSVGPAGPAPPSVAGAEKSGKFLVVTGANFVKGAKVLVNGTPYKAKPQTAGSTTALKSKKAGKVVRAGDRVRVRNPDGQESNEVVFEG